MTLTAARIQKADNYLESKINSNGIISTVRELIERHIKDGWRPWVAIVPKTKEMTSRQCFRASNEEQRKHEYKKFSSGFKNEYSIEKEGSHIPLTKTGYDYAVSIAGNTKKTYIKITPELKKQIDDLTKIHISIDPQRIGNNLNLDHSREYRTLFDAFLPVREQLLALAKELYDNKQICYTRYCNITTPLRNCVAERTAYSRSMILQAIEEATGLTEQSLKEAA